MALTRGEIKTQVQIITGKSNKDAFIETLCDATLKQAVQRHKFELARSTDDVSGTTGDTSFTLPSGTKNVISIAVIDGDNNAAPLTLKTETWYNEHVGVPEAYNSGWPDKGVRMGTSIELDRPIDADYTFRVRYTMEPTFAASDATECPLPNLDWFLVYYISAMIFQSLEDEGNFVTWMRQAVGNNFAQWNGGAFDAAVIADQNDTPLKHTALDIVSQQTKKPSLFIDGDPYFSP